MVILRSSHTCASHLMVSNPRFICARKIDTRMPCGRHFGSSLVYVVVGVHKSSLHSNMSIPPLYKLPFLFDEAKCIEFLLEKAIIYPAMRCQACGFTPSILLIQKLVHTPPR